jgi:hypothetical protein
MLPLHNDRHPACIMWESLVPTCSGRGAHGNLETQRATEIFECSPDALEIGLL